ncbi:hypothetical protein C0989_011281 [Termitomyces sp. Mn162]|nr:hypothetical protein C0989_011281 [Termitomyces sp. Mn162]KAH0584674.1 hypothetical protein H2248_010202 [Termitomyces sp. 'cryptogamus']
MTHYIRTIHTDFTARAAAAPSGPAKYPPALPGWPSPLAVSSGAQQPSYVRRTRRTPAVSYRRPAPPPPPRTAYACVKFDPFDDQPECDPVLYRTSPRLTPASLTLSTPAPRKYAQAHAPLPPPAPAPAPAPIDPNARSRLVAGILLNRVHAVGRPMRRRSIDGPREYVKSGLSSVISVEA